MSSGQCGLDPPFDGASELGRLLRAAAPVGPSHLDLPPTRVFGPRPPKPVVRPRRRRRSPALLLAPVAALAALSWRAGHAGGPLDCEQVRAPDGAQVVRGDTSGAGCLSVGVYEHEILTIPLRPDDPAPRRFALGRPGDVLMLGDWSCRGVATPALFRPSTGVTLYYGSWTTSQPTTTVVPECR